MAEGIRAPLTLRSGKTEATERVTLDEAGDADIALLTEEGFVLCDENGRPILGPRNDCPKHLLEKI